MLFNSCLLWHWFILKYNGSGTCPYSVAFLLVHSFVLPRGIWYHFIFVSQLRLLPLLSSLSVSVLSFCFSCSFIVYWYVGWSWTVDCNSAYQDCGICDFFIVKTNVSNTCSSSHFLLNRFITCSHAQLDSNFHYITKDLMTRTQ